MNNNFSEKNHKFAAVHFKTLITSVQSTNNSLFQFLESFFFFYPLRTNMDMVLFEDDKLVGRYEWKPNSQPPHPSLKCE